MSSYYTNFRLGVWGSEQLTEAYNISGWKNQDSNPDLTLYAVHSVPQLC